MTPTKITITVKLLVEGIHNFPQVEELFPEVRYLVYPHRHTFHIACEAEVTHTERDVEFICFQHLVKKYLHGKYFCDTKQCHNFGAMSCESIALELYETFNLESCVVGEDGEFFATVSKKDYQTVKFKD